MEKILEISNLTVKTDTKIVLKEISLDIPEKRIIWLKGKTGSGKSTLFKTLLNILPKNFRVSGEVKLQKENIFNYSQKQLASKIQLVFQDPYASLFPLWNIEKILLEPIRTLNLSLNKPLENYLKIFNLPSSILKAYPQHLSTGEKQKIAILRSLLPEPIILLADEPFSSLDVFSAEDLLHFFKAEREKRTLIISSHQPILSEEADIIITLEKGKIVELIERKNK